MLFGVEEEEEEDDFGVELLGVDVGAGLGAGLALVPSTTTLCTGCLVILLLVRSEETTLPFLTVSR